MNPYHLIVGRSQGAFGWVLYDGHPTDLTGSRLLALRTGFWSREAAHRDGESFYHMLKEMHDD